MTGLRDTIDTIASAERRRAGHPAQAQKTLAFPLKTYDKQKFLAREAQGISCI